MRDSLSGVSEDAGVCHTRVGPNAAHSCTHLKTKQNKNVILHLLSSSGLYEGSHIYN